MSLAGEFYALDIPTYLYRVSHKRIAWDERKATDLFKGLRECLTLSKEFGLYELHKKICQRLNACTFRTALCETIKYPVVRGKCIDVLDAIDTDIAGKDFLETLDTSYKAICKYKETGVLVSVIVPVYNVEEELGRCLDSVLVQSLDCIEIICVNDGSTDSSGEILDRYARVDNRIVIINKENGGVSSARNAALPFVKGSYIYFLDSDDWIESDTLEQLVMHMTGNVDVVVAGAIIEDEGGADADRLNSLKNYHSAKINGEFAIDDSLIDKITVTPWVKLFKNSIIQETGLTFLDGRKYEDNHFTIEYLIHAKNCFFVKNDFYHYVQRANSIMNSVYSYEDSLYIFDYLYKRLNNLNLLSKHKKLISKRYLTHLSISYSKTDLVNRNDVLSLAEKLAQDYNPDYFETDLVLHVKRGEFALEPLFDKDILIVLNTQLSNISNAVNTVTSLLSQSYKTPKIWLILDCDTEMRNIFFPTEFSKYMGKNLFIKYTNDSKSSSIIEKLKTITDQIIITLETGISYPKNMLRCLMSAYLSNKAAFKVSSFNSVEEINKDALFKNFAILSFELNNTIVVYKSKNLIVSLTSYPARISSVALALKTIYEQTKLPDEIVLWLAKSQFINKFDDLPKELKELVSNNKLKVRWCDEDLKPHKKYFYAFKEYPDALIVTIDDDLLYHPNMIENLFLSFLLHPNAISATRAHLIPILPSGDILPYKAWPKEIDAFVNEPSMQLCATCGAGALHPTILFSKVKDLLDEETIKETCLYADDLWLKAIQLVANVPVVVSEEYRGLYYTPNSQDVALWHKNLEQEENDRQLLQIQKEIDKRYGEGFFLRKLISSSVGEKLIGELALCNLITIYKNKAFKEINQIKKQYDKYSTLRVDISLKGSKGAYVDEKSVRPKPLSLIKPPWLPGGIVISSNAGTMKAVIQCHGDGELIIGILGIDIRNKHGQRYPIWIDCSRFAVNDEIIFDEVKTVCHDKRFIHKRVVKNGDILVLDFAWSECQSPSLLNEYKTLQTKVKNVNAKVAATETALKNANAKVVATEIALKNVNAKVVVTETALKNVNAKVVATETALKNVNAKVAATETALKNANAKATATETALKNANAKATATETALKKQLAKVQKDNTIFKSQIESLENSYSFKIGRAITYVPRKIRGGIRCYQDHGGSYTIKRTIEHFGIDMGTGDFKKNK